MPVSKSEIVPISTHAPLRGATGASGIETEPPYDFYSRASARRDAITTTAAFASESFLLTRLCEARHWARTSSGN